MCLMKHMVILTWRLRVFRKVCLDFIGSAVTERIGHASQWGEVKKKTVKGKTSAVGESSHTCRFCIVLLGG